MSIPVATPFSLSGGIYLQTREYKNGFHMDVNHLNYLNGQFGVQPTHLGVIEPFITSGYIKNMGGIYDFVGMTPETIDVDGMYTWETPEAGADDFYIVEDLSCVDKPGIDEQPFKLRFNRFKYGNTAVLSNSKFAKFDLLVTNDEILQDGDTFIYTVVLKGQNSKTGWFSKEHLRPGTRFVQKTSMHGDTSTIYNTGELGSTRMAKYFNYAGQTKANFFYEVGGGASGRTVPNAVVKSLQDYKQVVEMYFFKPGSEAFEMQLQGIDPVQKIYSGDRNAANRDIVLSSWVPAAEVAAKARIELDCQQEAIWGTGGTVFIDGQVKHTPIGLYHQLNRGNQQYYSIENMTLEKFNGLLTSFFSQRAEPYQMNVIEIITGNGGFNMMKNLLKHLPEQNGMVTNSDKYLSGPTNDMFFATPSITSYQFVYGTIKFKLNRSLDPLNDSDVENPKIGGFRLSSYMFIVMDALGGNNVKMLRCKEGWDFQWRFENGKSNYMGSQTGFHGKINAPYDFLVAMEKKHYAYWLQDPTRSFIMKPYNPITKKPFGEI